MRRIGKTGSLLLCLLLVSSLAGCVDQSGAAKQQETASKQVVATSVTICEILDALEVNSVIGVPDTDTYTIPERYEAADKVGAAMNPDMEIIAALGPELVLSPISLKSELEIKYENSGLEAYFLDLSSTQGMYASILELGELLDVSEKAAKLNQQFEDYMTAFQEKNQGQEAPKVLLLMGLPGSYVVATQSSYAGSLVELAGGENVYTDDEAFLNVNPEDMIQKEPDIILLTAHALPEQVNQMFEEEFAENDVWQHFEAVENEKVYMLDHNKFGMSANFNYQDALEDLQELLYEEE